MAESGLTVVYTDGGETYLGEMKDQKLNYWFLIGRDHQQKFMYKGYRHNSFRNMSDSVIVFDTSPWSDKEIARRKENGFLGIREYDIKGKVIVME